MNDALAWLFAVEAIGLAGFGIAFFAFPALRDRGWGFARPLGLIVVSYGVWMLSYAGLVPNSRLGYAVVAGVVLLAGGTALYARRHELRAWIRREWVTVVVGEAVFLLFFAGWVTYRAFDPAISGTEKPMDFMFLNASTLASNAPPADPWLAGHPVAYYYFGYWIFAGLGLISGVPTSIGFNLALATVAALSAGAIFSLVAGLVGASGGSRRAAISSGLASVVLLTVAGNLIGLWELASLYHVGGRGFFDWLAIDGIRPDQAGEAWRPERFWWWWTATRVINTVQGGTSVDYTIEEFPFFSFLLGDLHPHVMGIPFVLTGLGLAAALFLSPVPWGIAWWKRQLPFALLLALVIGALGFINAWDIAIITIVLVALVVIKTYRQRTSNLLVSAITALLPAAPVVLLALVAYAPFYFGTFSSQVPADAPIGATRFPTRPVHFLTVWGLFITILAPFAIVSVAGTARMYAEWAWTSLSGNVRDPQRYPVAISALWLLGVSLVVPFLVWAGIHLEVNAGASISDLGGRALSISPLALGAFAATLGALYMARHGASDGRLFAMVLLSIVLYLLYGVELIFVHDLFGNRMNTVFKTYYQAWILLSVIGGVAIHYWLSRRSSWSGWRSSVSTVAGVLAGGLVAIALYYPFASAATKAAGGPGPTLDGLAHVGADERAAIEWLSQNAPAGAVLVEAVGSGYTEFGRISSSTGIPTVFNWPGHERQWRGAGFDFGTREADVELIYVTEEVEAARRLLDKYDVRYVFLGERERNKYPSLKTEKFDSLGRRTFESGVVVIYDVRESSSE
ncbi:MAG: hypothetical protein FJ314_01585 [SAR202 cluster bacterium]|nr:hypothetical protein [SAR202 cluster bacterium]